MADEATRKAEPVLELPEFEGVTYLVPLRDDPDVWARLQLPEDLTRTDVRMLIAYLTGVGAALP